MKATAVILQFLSSWLTAPNVLWKHSSLAECYYLWQGDYVVGSIGLSVCLSFSNIGLLKELWTDYNDTV